MSSAGQDMIMIQCIIPWYSFGVPAYWLLAQIYFTEKWVNNIVEKTHFYFYMFYTGTQSIVIIEFLCIKPCPNFKFYLLSVVRTNHITQTSVSLQCDIMRVAQYVLIKIEKRCFWR